MHHSYQIRREDHIDIDLEEIRENHWANIFKEGQREEKSIEILQEELIDFIHTTKATFGMFRVKTR